MSAPRGTAAFLVMWSGQAVSSLGNQLTGFALAVWTFQATQSVTKLALITFSTTAPSILLSPLAGALVDRWDRRRAMIASDAGAGLCTLALALLFLSGRLEVWQLYVALALSSVFQSLRWPALSASITLLVPKRQYGRASGLLQLALASAQVLGPTCSAALIATIQVQGVLLVDFVTFLLAILTLLLIRIPTPVSAARDAEAPGSLWRDMAFGWSYLARRPGLLSLLHLFAVTNFLVGMAVVLLTPLVLSFASTEVLGAVLSAAGAGLLVGGLAMAAWGGPRRRMAGILGFSALQGSSLLLAAVATEAVLVALPAFIFLFGLSMISGCSQAIWQSKVAPEVQGRVFAMRRMVALGAVPVGSLLAGPMADQVFEPLLAAGGPLAPTLGPLLGVGPGSGIRLLLIALGLLLLATVATAATRRSLRRVEEELPDLVGGVGEPA